MVGERQYAARIEANLCVRAKVIMPLRRSIWFLARHIGWLATQGWTLYQYH